MHYKKIIHFVTYVTDNISIKVYYIKKYLIKLEFKLNLHR